MERGSFLSQEDGDNFICVLGSELRGDLIGEEVSLSHGGIVTIWFPPRRRLFRWTQVKLLLVSFHVGPSSGVVLFGVLRNVMSCSIPKQLALGNWRVNAWSVQMLSAVDHLKKLQMVHRDIKPENVFVSYGETKYGWLCACACVSVFSRRVEILGILCSSLCLVLVSILHLGECRKHDHSGIDF